MRVFTQTQGMEKWKKVHPADIPFRASMLFLSLFLSYVVAECLLSVRECEAYHVVVVSISYKVHLDILIWF